MLNNVLKKRQQQHFKTMIKYLKYVANDHFTIVFILLSTMIALEYRKFIETFTITAINIQMTYVFLSLGLPFIILIGRIATYIESADEYYLSLMQREWLSYLKKCFWKSQVVLVIPSILSILIVIPLLTKINNVLILPLSMTLILLKQYDLLFQFYNFKFGEKIKRLFLYVLSSSTLYLVLSTDFSYLIIVILIIIYVFLYYFVIQKVKKIDFQYVINVEKSRINTLYQFLQLFIDIPLLNEKIKTRKYLTIFLTKKEEVYSYYYEKLFIRSNSFIGIFTRLTIISMLLTFLIQQSLIYSVTIFLISYITLIQLLPLYKISSHYLLFALFPQSKKERKRQFINVLQKLMFIQVIVVATFNCVVKFDLVVFCSLLIQLVVIYFVFPLYVNRKIDKI